MTSNLQNKIDSAIEFLQRAEKLALKMQPDHGFWLCYSGGKDSDTILELAKIAGVKFTAYYNITTIDPPELVRYIIEQHPEVVRLHPKQTFLQIIKKKRMLPTRLKRFCCTELKETTAAGYCAITGVRAAESTRQKHSLTQNTIFTDADARKASGSAKEFTHLRRSAKSTKRNNKVD